MQYSKDTTRTKIKQNSLSNDDQQTYTNTAIFLAEKITHKTIKSKTLVKKYVNIKNILNMRAVEFHECN
jgi:hypothetical protein